MLQAIVAAVIAGLIIWWITGQCSQPSDGHTPGPGPSIEQKKIYDPYEVFISVATSKDSRNPLDIKKVRDAIKLVIRGEDIKGGKKLMMDAGYPDGISLIMLLTRFKNEGGSEGEAQLLINKLRPIGVRVTLIK